MNTVRPPPLIGRIFDHDVVACAGRVLS